MSREPKKITQKGGKRSETVKVSVLFPRATAKKLQILAKRNRRKLSPQVVEITENCLAAMEAGAAASG